MNITLLISSLIIQSIPYGWSVPFTNYKCWDIAASYHHDTQVIYLCEWVEWEKDFYKYHEIGHYIYYQVLTDQQRLLYNISYEKSLKQGKKAFYREYWMLDEKEDFADNFALMMIKKNLDPYVMKRIRLIKSILWNP